MSAHTEGRIQFRANGDANSYALLDDQGRWWLSLLMNGEQHTVKQEANLRRLAACWNACELMSTEDIEKVPAASGINANVILKAAVDATVDRGQLRTELALFRENYDKMTKHAVAVEAELATAKREVLRAESSHDSNWLELQRVKADLAAARALLDEVLAAHDANAIATEFDGAPDTTVDFDHTAERIRELLGDQLNTEPDAVLDVVAGTCQRWRRGADTTDHPAVASAKTIIEHAARDLLKDVADLGMVLTITQRPLMPYAMGNYETVVDVRQARERAV